MSMEALYRGLFKDLTDVEWRYLHLLEQYPPEKYYLRFVWDDTDHWHPKVVDFDVIPIRCDEGIHLPSQKLDYGGSRHPDGCMWCYFCKEDLA